MLTKLTRASMIVAVCTLIGLAWRAEGLLRRSFWVDEVLTFWRAQMPTVDALLTDLASTPFPPLYYVLLWGWTRIWGVSELSVRALPLIFGVVTIPATYLVWAGLIGRNRALWATALLSTNAFHVFYSQDAKMYAAVWFLATVSSGAFLHALVTGPRQVDWLAAYGISNAALLQVSYVGVVPMAIQFLYGLMCFSRVRPIAGRLSVAAALSCVPCVAWLPNTLRAVTQRTGISWIPPVSGYRMAAELSQAFGYYALGYRVTPDYAGDMWGWCFSQLYAPAEWLAAAVILVYLIRLVRRPKDVQADKPPEPQSSAASLYLVLSVVVPAVAAFLFSIIVYPLWGPPRYLTASGPAILLLLGSALGSLERQALAGLLGATLISGNAGMILFEKSHITSDPYRQMVGASAALAWRSPEIQSDACKDPGGIGVIHVERGPWWNWNEMPVKHEIDEVDAALGTQLFRLDTLENAVRRGTAFFVLELRSRGDSEEAAREWLNGRIAAIQGGATGSSGRFEVRPIFAAEVRADGPLPNPMMSYTAQAWACFPARRGSPGKSQGRTGSGRAGP
jgi:hypothetical protein